MMESSQDGSFSRPHWSVEDIPYRNIEPDQADISLELFYMLTCASFVKITSGLYTRNLTEYIHDEPELRDWLERQWRCEEIQHGIALRCYVNMVWPKFDWDRAYSRFFIEYSRCCQAKQLGPTPGTGDGFPMFGRDRNCNALCNAQSPMFRASAAHDNSSYRERRSSPL